MLPSRLLLHAVRGEEVVPRRLPLEPRYLELAAELIELFASCHGRPRSDLDEQLQALEGDATDYRIRRGLAHLLLGFATFETVAPLEPSALRARVFAASAGHTPSEASTRAVLAAVARNLSDELGRPVSAADVAAGLYADLAENAVMTDFAAPSPEALLHRYNLAQVQGALYRARDLVITAHRNVPGEYKLLFRYLKLFGLMSLIEGDADHGFTITIDGPASLFGGSTRYGVSLAKFLPALLHVSRWQLVARLAPYRPQQPNATLRLTLDADSGLVSHYKKGKPFDSIVEEAFAARWAETRTPWVLEREVDLLPVPGSVMVPDFRLVHPDSRTALLEIVGYWRPDYLRKKFRRVRQAGVDNLLLAVSERLDLERAGVRLGELRDQVVWFKGKLRPNDVLAALESLPLQAERS